MADTNGDGYDDQTGQAVAGNAVGGQTSGIDSYIASIQAGGGGVASSSAQSFSPQTAATNYLQSYEGSSIWLWQPIVTGAKNRETAQILGYAGEKTVGNGITPTYRHPISEQLPSPTQLTPFQLLQRFDNMSRKDYLKFRNRMIAAGFVSSNATAADVKNAYSGLLENVVQQQYANQNMATPNDIINNLIRLNGINPDKIGSDPDYTGAVAKDTTYTQKSVYDLNPAQARQTLEQALQQELGRAPTKAEVEDFVNAVQTHAADDPTTVTTHYHTDAQGNTVASQNTHSGFGAENVANMAEGVGKHAPDYKSYAAVSTYFPALQQALGATI